MLPDCPGACIGAIQSIRAAPPIPMTISSHEERMGEPNLIDVTSDREISRVIHYLDPDFHAPKASSCQHPDREALIMLILLLGGVIACFVALYIRMAE